MSTEINFIVHDDPAIRPRRPRLAMIDLAPFEFEGQMEEVWLRTAGSGEYELCCLPFRVYGLALGDLVGLDEAGKMVRSLIKPAGHRLFRAFVKEPLSDPAAMAARERIVAAVAESKLVSEWSGDRHVAIHVPLGEFPAGPLGTAIHESHDIVVSEWADVEPFRTA